MDNTVGHQDLLKASRDACVHLTDTKAPATPTPDDSTFHSGSRPIWQLTQVSMNAAVKALIPTATSDESTLNAVLSFIKTFDEQVRLNEQRFQEQDDKINLLSKSCQWFSRGCGRWPRSRRSFRRTPPAVPQQETGWATQCALALQRYNATTAISSIISSRIVFWLNVITNSKMSCGTSLNKKTCQGAGRGGSYWRQS